MINKTRLLQNIVIKLRKRLLYRVLFSSWCRNNENYLNHLENKLYTFQETLNKVISGQSLARFGDGEFQLILERDIDFQVATPALAQELQKILCISQDNLCVCLPTIKQAGNDYEAHWWLKFWYIHGGYLFDKLTLSAYGRAMVTRPDFFLLHSQDAIKMWKQVWDNKNVLFITGKQSKLDIHHILFDNVKSKQIIYSLTSHAYQDIENIMQQVVNLDKQQIDLVLVALGPTGTVLAYRLSKLQYHTIDIGHITSSYDEVFV